MIDRLDFEKMRETLRALHDAFIDAHVNNNPEFMVRDLDEHYVNVSRGELVRATKRDILEQFTRYLGNTEFSEYSMPEEPEIRFSDDGSVAWSVFRLHVVATWESPDGIPARRRPLATGSRGVESHPPLEDPRVDIASSQRCTTQ